ncbi:MAG: hypothetical protein WD757_07685 [Actinomycetota bacterium]
MRQRAALVVVAVALFAMAAYAQPALAAVIVCGGGDCIGTSSPDDITGTDGYDRIEGRAGGDTISALNSSDKVFGQLGADWMHGDGGHDRMRGGGSDDTIWGDAQHDRVWGGPNDDTLNMQDDNSDPVVNGGNGYDVCNVDAIDTWSNCEVVNVA